MEVLGNRNGGFPSLDVVHVDEETTDPLRLVTYCGL
jgi:hypothetical protein